MLSNLLQSPFGGPVFPVNPRRASVLGVKAYPDLAAVPEPVDLAVVVTPAPTVPGVVRRCAEAGVKGAIVISAGFKELGPEGIRVNVVSPGVIATDMQSRVTSDEQLRATAAQIPQRRIGVPDDCTGAFLYLCSDGLSAYVTGQVIEVNGGMLMP